MRKLFGTDGIRGISNKYQGEMKCSELENFLEYNKVENIRFSGGEPTLHPKILNMVMLAKCFGVKRIAISTNGSADISTYKTLIKNGVNDMSISLDACCSTDGKKMCGIDKQWEIVSKNIKELAKLTYISIGIVITKDNESKIQDIINFSESLGVSDVRIIPSAQYNKLNIFNFKTDLPILKYRINNLKNGIPFRGIQKSDTHKCPLVLDDVACCSGYHFPCIIYFREGGKPIGKINSNIRKDRYDWFKKHNSKKDKICSKNCLDVCREYNNKWIKYN